MHDPRPFTRRILPPLLLACTIAGCSLPRDPDGTMDRVERTHKLRLGLPEAVTIDGPSRRTLATVLRKTDAKLQVERGDSDHLLSSLEHGKLDLVYGEFPKSSPWSKSVHFGTAQGQLAPAPKTEPVPRFAMMNGENGWIMLVEKASK